MAFMEPAAVARERERTLRIVLPLGVLVCLSGTGLMLNGSQAHSIPYMFDAGGLSLLVAWMALRRRWVSYGVALAITIVVAGALHALHIASLFVGPTYRDPQVSLLDVTYAFFPVYLTLLVSLLRYPASLWWGLGAWLVVAGGTTLFTVPYWGEIPVREGLRATLMLLWIGYPVFLVLLTGTARRYARMLGSYAQQARRLARLHGDLERRVAERTVALQQSSERWQERNTAVSTVNELIGFLLSSRDEAEACRITATYMPRILRGTSGALLLADGDAFLPAAGWGPLGAAGQAFSKASCWAARRGLPHRAHAGQSDLRCAHCRDVPECSCACEPLIVDGRIIGVLTVTWPADAPHTLEADAVLVGTVAEQLALALSNICLRAELQALAVRDPLTGLHNRRQLVEHLPRMIATAHRAGTAVSVLLADVDHFKQFNDRFGHDAGDHVLKAVAGAMSRSLREGDLAVRYGGEEFVAVLADCGPDDALRWAERLRAAVAAASAALDAERRMPPVTCSVGIASFPADGATMDQLLRVADRALYEAKGAGRNCVRVLKAA